MPQEEQSMHTREAPAAVRGHRRAIVVGSAVLVAAALIYRYRVPDGLAGQEGAFTACSFWYAECLARAGRVAEGRLVFEKMLGFASPVGLFSEEIGTFGEQLRQAAS